MSYLGQFFDVQNDRLGKFFVQKSFIFAVFRLIFGYWQKFHIMELSLGSLRTFQDFLLKVSLIRTCARKNFGSVKIVKMNGDAIFSEKLFKSIY